MLGLDWALTTWDFRGGRRKVDPIEPAPNKRGWPTDLLNLGQWLGEGDCR